jgi:predicted alpha/beta-fold hydrolase
MEFHPRPFRPARWLPGAHGQTIGGKLFRPEVPMDLVRERWDTQDGDFLDLDFAPEPAPGAPLAVVLHGFEGSARRRYTLIAYRELARHGIRAVGLNFRSCSGEPNRTSRSYHSGETGDLAFVIQRLKERFPGKRMGALGFSLGGNVLLKYLGERGDASGLSGAVVVSVPYDLAAASLCLESSTMGRLYSEYFLRSLREKVRAKAAVLEPHVRVSDLIAAKTLWKFDDVATAPLHGFTDAKTYYAESSSAGWISRITVPTLLLHSTDDPFLPPDAIPWEAIRANEALVPAIEAHGGHVGFIEGSPLRPRFWAEEEAARFLGEAL